MKRYSLEPGKNTRFVKVLQVIFGIVCISIAIWWAIYLLRSKENNDYWAASIFMLGFGAFQIYSGMGYADKYIMIGRDTLIIKKSVFGKKVTVMNNEIEKIDIHPLSVSLTLNGNSKITISFAVTLAGGIDRIKDALADFGKENNIITEDGMEGK